jgi:hypothetical protein
MPGDVPSRFHPEDPMALRLSASSRVPPRVPPRALLAGLAGALGVLACAVAPAREASAQTGVWRQIALPGAGANAVAGGDSGRVLAVSTAGLFRYDGLRVRRKTKLMVMARTGIHQ